MKCYVLIAKISLMEISARLSRTVPPLEVVSEEFIHDKIHPEQDNEVVFEPKINYDKFIGTGDEIEYVGKIDEVVIVKREEEEDK